MEPAYAGARCSWDVHLSWLRVWLWEPQVSRDARRSYDLRPALEVNDTLRMRELSWGVVRDSVVAIRRDLPRAYGQFARPTPRLVTLEGGGMYQGDVSAAFLVTSRGLGSCNGGVRLDLLMIEQNPRVVSVRLQPPIDSVTDDACRAAIGRS
jgi:hypothetical protein